MKQSRGHGGTETSNSKTVNGRLAQLASGPINTDELLRSLEHDLMTVVIRYSEPTCLICGENEPAVEDACTLNGPGVERCTTFVRYGACLACVKRIDKLSPREKTQMAESVVHFFEAWLAIASVPTGKRMKA